MTRHPWWLGGNAAETSDILRESADANSRKLHKSSGSLSVNGQPVSAEPRARYIGSRWSLNLSLSSAGEIARFPGFRRDGIYIFIIQRRWRSGFNGGRGTRGMWQDYRGNAEVLLIRPLL